VVVPARAFKSPRDDVQHIYPQGKRLKSEWRQLKNPRNHFTKADTFIYRASQLDCGGCSLKDRCCPDTSHRKIARTIHELARDVACAISKTEQYQQSRNERKKGDRLRLRGLSGAHDEFLLVATAQNLRRMAKRLVPIGQGPAMQGA